jgi:methylmalonyl-CoA mutase
VSEFPNLYEAPVSVLIAAPSPPADGHRGGGRARPDSAGATEERRIVPFTALVEAAGTGAPLSDLAASARGPDAVATTPLPSTRAAEPFERLRERSDAYLARTGERPTVFLANLGPVADFTERATFAKSFFEAGGIEAVTNEGFQSLDLLLDACSHSKARLFCVCGSDKTYKEQLESTIEGLRAKGKSPIYVACRPGVLIEDIKRAGPTTFIFAGCDSLTILSEALDAACA